jgi:putative ABC transport system permease protein
VADYIRENIPDVEEVVRFSFLALKLQYKEKCFWESYSYACDEQVFSVFDFKLLKGNPKTALASPNSVVLSEKISKKHFGDEDPLGKMLTTYTETGEPIALKVTGILQNVPQNSHFHIEVLVSMKSIKHFVKDDWYENNWHGANTYMLLAENSDPNEIQSRIDELLIEKVPLQGFNKASLPMQPLTSIFFNPTKDGSSQRGNKAMTYVLLTLGIFILFIASLNYINLTTARSLKRNREVGIRKVMGAHKSQLIWQFMGESLFIAFVSLLFAIILMQLFIPHLNSFSNLLYQIDLDSNFLSNGTFLSIAFGTTFLTGLLSGIYPALVLSGFNPVKALRGNKEKRGSISMKKGLVIIQYVVSVVLIVGSIGVYKVYNFMLNQDFGFNKDHLMAINLVGFQDDPRILNLKDQLGQQINIKALSLTSKVPMSLRDDYSVYMKDPFSDHDQRVTTIYIDENYFDLLEVEYNGEMVSLSMETEKVNMIVNQTFMDRYGEYYKVGDEVELYDFSNSNTPKTIGFPEIKGVVKNFKGRNLIFEKPMPHAYILSREKGNYLLARLDPEDRMESLSSVESTFKEIFPDQVFQYSFIDDEINTFMSIFSPFAKLIFYGTFFAIFIASMGLFALALYVTQQRTKEIGIRKVFGASVKNISVQLARHFIRLVLIAFVIAGPITFFGFRKMLQILPEKIVLEWTLLVGIGMGIVILALGTVLAQSWNAARTNPVVTLRYE